MPEKQTKNLKQTNHILLFWILDCDLASNYLNFDVVLQYATQFTIINMFQQYRLSILFSNMWQLETA